MIKIPRTRFLTLGFALLLLACSVRLISDYDEETDRATTELQRKTEAFLFQLERTAGTPDGEYPRHERLYDKLRVDLSSLRLRAAARPKNELQVDQIDLLVKNLENLESLHKLGLTREQMAPLRNAFYVSFTAILKLELAKKRGD